MSKRGGRRLRRDFNLGGEQAEADPLLLRAFYESEDYAAIESRLDTRCFVIGRTGGGKSAALQRLEETHPGHVVRITPEDLSLPYITDRSVYRFLDSLDVHLDLLFIALWKHVLLVELLRHRYKIDSPAVKQNVLTTLRDRISRDRAKAAALEYLDEFEGKFWCEADERVREITERFEQRVGSQMEGQLAFQPFASVKGGTSDGETFTTETRIEQAERFQRIVNETQLARLNKMINVLDEDILDDPQHYTYVVIDDLDRDWVDERLANDLIHCLFRTVLDLKRVRNLKVLVALRTNIFEQLRFAERHSGQEEKFRSLILRMTWSKRDLAQLLDERARVAADLFDLPEINGVRDLLPRQNRARGDPLDFVLDRTLMRPRDAIAFLNEAISGASGKPRLSWDELHRAERPYSSNRLLALRDEWKATFPDIDKAFALFARAPVVMDQVALGERLDEVMLLAASHDFAGVRWVTAMSEPMLSSGVGVHEWAELYQPLIKLFFDIGLLGLVIQRGRRTVYSFDETGYADHMSNLGTDCAYSVHPAFRTALEITDADPGAPDPDLS